MDSLVLFRRPADLYPFILLKLALRGLASIQAPVIPMNQNRQEANDHLLLQRWERLTQIQKIQLEILSERERG